MALDRTKTDPKLGAKVNKHLLDLGIETPTAGIDIPNKKSKIEEAFKTIMETLNLDLSDDSLQETPKRVAKMFVDETLWGLDYDNFPKITATENKMQYKSMLIERSISVKSLCEHHWQAITGTATVAYIPHDKVLGLSKLNRVVEFFSRRPQVQERLTEQIYHALSYILATKNIAVIITAEHHCVKIRGTEDTHSDTITSRMGGAFETDINTRNELINLIKI